MKSQPYSATEANVRTVFLLLLIFLKRVLKIIHLLALPSPSKFSLEQKIVNNFNTHNYV